MTLEQQLTQMRDATLARMPQSIIKVFQDSLEQIRQDRLKEKALQVGDKIPNFFLTDITGSPVELQELHQNEYLVLNFYRGGWCPYCNMELREYERLKNEFIELGANIVGISAEVPELAIQTRDKNALSFPVLTDIDAQFMRAVGIVFELDEASKQEYENFGIDLNRIHGNFNFELPVPAVYVINKEREIVFTHFEEDYMTRLEPQELLSIIQKLNIAQVQ